MKARFVLGVGGCVCVYPCMAEHTVQYCGGWLTGAATGKRQQRRLRLGLCYRTQLSFPPWRAPLSPLPREVSLLLPSPRYTAPPFPSLPSHPFPPFSTSSPSLTPSLPSFHIHPALCRATFNQGGGGLQRFSLSLGKDTHMQCVCVYAQFAKTVFPV